MNNIPCIKTMMHLHKITSKNEIMNNLQQYILTVWTMLNYEQFVGHVF
jgi:arginine repressor